MCPGHPGRAFASYRRIGVLFGVLLTRSSTYTHPALAAPARPATRHSVPHHLLSGDRVRVRTHVDGGNKAHDLQLRC